MTAKWQRPQTNGTARILSLVLMADIVLHRCAGGGSPGPPTKRASFARSNCSSGRQQ